MPTFDAFYERLRGAERLPTTSQPSIGDFLDVYGPLVDEGYEVASIHISGAISGTVDAAGQAKERLAEEKGADRVTVIDSERSAGGLGLLALAGARAASAGGDMQAVVERIETARRHLKMWFAVDTLEYLRRGGRIGKAGALLGSALSIKPILGLRDGHIVPLERVRTSTRAIARIEDLAVEAASALPAGASGVDVAIHHLDSPERAERLAERLRVRLGEDVGLLVVELGAVVGAHVGPGTLAVAVVPRIVPASAR
jgi:DegV family protein with EDD domain